MKRFALYLSFILIALMVAGPFYSLKESLSAGKLPPEITRQHMLTGNTTRLACQDWTDMQDLVWNIKPAAKAPKAVVVAGSDSWPLALACQSFSAPPLNLPVLLYENDRNLKEKIIKKINSFSPAGLDKLGGTQVILAGKATALAREMQKLKLNTYEISGPNTPTNVTSVFTTMQKLNALKTRDVLVTSDERVSYALPASTWLAQRGTPLLLTSRNDIPQPTRKVLEQGNNWQFYVLGPRDIVGEDVINELKKWGEVNRIGAPNPFGNAVKFASFYDHTNRFGWQATQVNAESAQHLLLGSIKDNWQTILAGTQLFSGSNFGPLLLTKSEKLPSQVQKFLWSLSPDWWVTPAEGPFNHLWLLGGLEQISYAVQGRVDFIQELRDYLDQGDQGVSGIDALALVWFALALASAIWTWFHLSTRLTQVDPFMKISWILVMLVLGPVGLWAYYTCYRGYDHQTVLGQFPRPLCVQVLSATLGTVGFGMSTMVAAAFLLAYFGMPLFTVPGFFFWLGSPMTQSIIWSYLVALIVNMFLFVPLMLRAKESSSYSDTVRDNTLTVFISMTSISIGMMSAMWLLQMRGLTVMPEEENLIWWGTVWAANLVGLVTGYIGNWPLVVKGRKIGTM
ncbi:MAG: DUF4396 domain-containing protein [Clostridiales bacterium]|nr:DUF4396 domain-containing protein [Clostridiales bacterium]MCF8023595.1 DUF4396 domain-containing protein [Clostridiales bacterium]